MSHPERGRRPRSVLSSAEGSGLFARLGRGLVRHAWPVIAFWSILALVALPFLSHIGGVEANSATSLPSSAPSSIASARLAELFPGDSPSGSSAIVLITGPDITGPAGQNATLGVAQRIASDPNLTELSGISTMYTAYASDLAGLAEIAGGVLEASSSGGAAYAAENASAQAAWGPPSAFLAEWQALLASHPGSDPGSWNAPAFNATAASLSGSSGGLAVLEAFYGAPGETGWNGTNACAQAPAEALACAQAAVRAGPVYSLLAPSFAAALPELGTAIDDLGPVNFTETASLQSAAARALVQGSSVPYSFVQTVEAAFPNRSVPPAQADRWATDLVDSRPVSDYPIPVPEAILGEFVDPARNATVVVVDFAVAAGYTTAGGANPIFADVQEIDRILPSALASSDPSNAYSAWLTGDAALNAQESSDLASDLAIVLPLTVMVLVGITIVYFRSPVAPLLTFGTLGIAIVLAFAGVVALGTFVTKVDPTSLTLATTFVLGVGTDYSVFLVARYREELLKGSGPREAVVTTVAWAGQSIATSGATAILATLALAFSGVGLLSQWGMVLSVSVLLTLLASLTLVPAVLVVAGPRILWPDTGLRFAARAQADRRRMADARTYFHRAARRSRRRPGAILVLALVASVPLFYVALEAPVNYDFYAQLPGGEPASTGLAHLAGTFGPGYAFPSFVLVTFASPLMSGNASNVSEFTDISEITGAIGRTAGVAAVRSPVGPDGASLADWARVSNASPVERTLLDGVLAPYLGDDGRTVWITFRSNASGLALASVSLVDSVRSDLHAFAGSRPEIVGLAFGGGAQTTADLEAQTAVATERMVAAVSVGLVVVLFAVLRSYWMPPMAVATIGLSIGWAWAITYLVLGAGFGDPILFFVPTILFLLILGLGIDYTIFLLTRVREERLRGLSAGDAASEGVARTGGIITAAAIILASAFAVLTTGRFLLLQAIGFSVATAVLLDAMVVRTYLVPALLHLGGERIWSGPGRRRRSGPVEPPRPVERTDTAPSAPEPDAVA